ncbi:MAG: EAL domain-containing protein [Sphingomonadales bacterium]|nr:EAL domain-containing protein [Sphingomonadales bacterium]MDE2568152.1 EAL domain-containing protein [Sphingomonadales bacterium]
MRRLRAGYRQRRGDHFTIAYAANLSQRIPPLYGLVLLSALLLEYRFQGDAPILLTVAVPAMVAMFSLQRMVHWLPHQVERRDVATLRRDLGTMTWSGGLSALVLVVWVVALYPYGNDAQKSLIHYIVSVVGFCGILCLAEAPLTALFFGIAISLPSTLFFITQGHPNAVFVSIVEAVVTIMLLAVANAHHRDFVRLELSREKIIRRERQAARLASDNLANATFDALTGVLNRRAFLAALERAMDDAEQFPWIALIDLDGFKHINDTYGHSAGDAVLKAVAERIGEQDGAFAHGRLGGDEFALILDGALPQDEAVGAMKALSRRIAQPIADRDTVLRLSACIGLKRTEKLNVTACLERADSALYKAKELGDGAVCLFEPDDEVALAERVAITRRFNAASLPESLRLLYQPVWDIEDQRIIGYEALTRWTPDEGASWLSPEKFIPLADATGRSDELTRLVISRALEECRVWENGQVISINLSPRDVLREGAAETIGAVVRDAGAVCSAITLDVTERALVLDSRRAIRNLEAMRAMGFRISFDDFGVGGSSLGNIHRLPLDVLKIDRALTTVLASDAGARAIAGTILTLAWQLDIDCVIEGVETEAQAEVARALGIRYMQGYRFGRPLPIAEAMAAARRAA